RWLALPLLLLVPLLAGALYLGLGTPAALLEQSGGGPGAMDIEAMVDGLAARLEQAPDDAEGWAMLGRSYMVLKRYPEAASAFGRLRELVGDDPRVLVRLADALAMTHQRVSGQPARLLRQALKQDPENVEALWMLGMAEAEKGRYRQALDYWQKAEGLLEEEPQARAELQGLIRDARARLGMAQADQKPQQDTPEPGARKETGTAAIPVEVSLDPALKGAAPADAALFILARAVDGPPMPLAVVRRKVSDLPLTVRLDDSLAMMPQMRISAFPRVRVEARISLSGQAKPGPGDLQARPVEVDTGAPAPVRLLIDQRLP
ncbi:MAG: c-type cytochrome biogenesis protein CcmI, partial [Gammaproteobacteria bacterium]